MDTAHGRYITLVDLTGLGAHHVHRPSLKFFSETQFIEENIFPEMVQKVIIFNAPKIFNVLYGMIKHAFDPVTRSKFEFFGTSGYKERLLELIDEVVTFSFSFSFSFSSFFFF